MVLRLLVPIGLTLVCATSAPAQSEPSAASGWELGSGFRSRALKVPASSRPGFTLLKAAQTGVVFNNQLHDATISTNRLLEIGSGVAMGDMDGDGWVDLYFCSLEGNNALYRNLGGWRFEDVTESAGVACPHQFSTGCAFVDIDGDGDLDLFVNGLGCGTRLFLNQDGRGHFVEPADSGLARRLGATSMAFADVDGDGDLDLYVTNYRSDTFSDNPPGFRMEMRQQADGTQVLEPRLRFVTLQSASGLPTVVERGEPDILYLNRGGGKFAAAPWDKGVFVDEHGVALTEPPTDWGLAVMFRDLNGDHLPDLYVCNDFVYWPDRIWLNERGKRFRAAPREAIRQVSVSSMAVDVADVNRDGVDDLLVVDMLSQRREARAWQRPDLLRGSVRWPVEDPAFRPETPRNTLHLGRGDGTFAEIALLAGVSATDWTPNVAFLDVDLDGWEDLLFATGNKHDLQDMDALDSGFRVNGPSTPSMRLRNLPKLPSRAAPTVALRNRRDLTFTDVSADWGFNQVGVAQGMAFADLDDDGDLDVVMNCMNEPARLYRNDGAAPRLAVRLKGERGNTRGVGARIKVMGGPVEQTQEIIAGGHYCSSDDALRTFAAGDAPELRIEVTWRGGKTSLVSSALPNRVYEVEESAATAALPAAIAAPPQPLFENVSDRLNHVHVDAAFDDFVRQPLLPRKLSTLGPGVAWSDLDGDGDDDLLVGGGGAGRLVIFRNESGERFSEWKNAPLPNANARDQTAVIVWHGDGATRVLVGESNWEDAATNIAAYRVFDLRGKESTGEVGAFGSGLSSTGPIAMADTDGDGDLDLFVGGRVTAGRYPEAATSRLLRNDRGTFVAGTTFTNLGLVSGAVFSDLDGDGGPDLIVACEWGAVRVFHNQGGLFGEVTTNLGLASFQGRWNGVAAGDFNGDGRMDLIASNWGRNWRSDQRSGEPTTVSLFYGDFGASGQIQTLMASLDPALARVTPWRERQAIAAVMPWVSAAYPSYRAFAQASVLELLGARHDLAQELQAQVFDSLVFLNRGDHFEARPLPVEAQFAPAFGVAVADFDGDGHEDAFLAQNFFGVDAESSRQDAGAGLVLLGDGRGGFKALGPLQSGVAIYGEQRGCAVADFDRDGRSDVVVGQNAGPTALFRNRLAKPGLRVSLRGPRENPTGVGAVVRLKFDADYGPAREWHAGSGYWSQDSACAVLARPLVPTALLVRWPGGGTREWALPSGVGAVEVSPEAMRSSTAPGAE